MSDFLDNVQQHRLEWRGQPLLLPVFCYDNTSLTAVFTASTKSVTPLISVPGARPVELFPGRCLFALNCFEYRQTDIGPYNEVAISFLVSYRKLQIPGLSPLLQLLRRRYTAFVWQLPVTTEIARDGGLEIYGYPKFLADVEFTRERGRIRCTVREGGDLILSLEGPELPTRSEKPIRVASYSMKGTIPLIANIVQSPIQIGSGILRKDVSLTLGDHPLGRKLSELNLGKRALRFMNSPENESILFAARNIMDD